MSKVSFTKSLDWNSPRTFQFLHQLPVERDKCLAYVLSMEPRFLEELVADIWAALGYRVAMTRNSGDGGIDLVVRWNDKIYMAVQCKRYKPSRKVVPERVRAFSGAFRREKLSHGWFVTTSDFTKSCIEEATALRITLYSGEALVEHAVRAREALHRSLADSPETTVSRYSLQGHEITDSRLNIHEQKATGRYGLGATEVPYPITEINGKGNC